jgi:hypothetical protein
MRAFIPAIFLLAFAAPAQADVTLRYAADGQNMNSLVVEADDHGNVRAEANASLVFLIRGGETYLVRETPTGPAVARLADALAIATESHAHPTGGIALHVRRQRFTVVPHGQERVGEWNGAAYRLETVPPATGGSARVMVVSTDPALAPLALIMEEVMMVETRLFQAALGVAPDPEEDRQMHELLGRGLILRSSDYVHLDRLTRDPVPAERLALPGPILSRDQLRALLSHGVH